MQSDMHSPVSSSIHDDSVPWVSSNDAETRMAKSGKSETVACVLIWTGKGGTATKLYSITEPESLLGGISIPASS